MEFLNIIIAPVTRLVQKSTVEESRADENITEHLTAKFNLVKDILETDVIVLKLITLCNKDFATSDTACDLYELECADSKSEIRICLSHPDLKIIYTYTHFHLNMLYLIQKKIHTYFSEIHLFKNNT